MTALCTVLEAPAREPAIRENVVKNVALFLAAPFVALAYVIAFPFVGLAMLAWFAARAAARLGLVRAVGRTAMAADLMAGAPFIALAYVLLFPFVGLGMLAWMGGKALLAAEGEETAELCLVAAAA